MLTYINFKLILFLDRTEFPVVSFQEIYWNNWIVRRSYQRLGGTVVVYLKSLLSLKNYTLIKIYCLRIHMFPLVTCELFWKVVFLNILKIISYSKYCDFTFWVSYKATCTCSLINYHTICVLSVVINSWHIISAIHFQVSFDNVLIF